MNNFLIIIYPDFIVLTFPIIFDDSFGCWDWDAATLNIATTMFDMLI